MNMESIWVRMTRDLSEGPNNVEIYESYIFDKIG